MITTHKTGHLEREDFKRFFDMHFDPVRSYIYYRCGDIDLSTDIAQDVFIKVWEKKFDIDDDRIRGLLYKIARELFISKYRRKGLERRYIESLQFSYDNTGSYDDIEYQEFKTRYESALTRLPVTQREVFLMSRNEDMKYSEIAGALGISQKAVEKRMTAALSFLRKALGEDRR